MHEIHTHFSAWDWAVIVGYLALTTLVGHALRGRQASIRDFFLGGRSLPWPAVCGSIIATEISGVTFIGVPGTLFALNGNFTYLLWGIGSLVGRVLVAVYFVPVYYEREIYSPYDYIGARLGRRAKALATILFTLGSILAQSVRVLVAAIPLQVVTGLDISWCIITIGLFAIGWTLMGGMRTVIWTDVMQFALFTLGGLLALGWVISGLNGGWTEFWQTADSFGRLQIWDARLQAHLEFTIWVAIFAVPFQNLSVFGVDQLNAQRMFCCKNAQAARKALIFSTVGVLLTLLMLAVGAALFVHYHNNPFSQSEARILFPADSPQAALEQMQQAPLLAHPETGAESNIHKPAKPDYVFPMWITTVLPVGLSGLILAGVFAAAVSSLDSILAALSQTTLSLIYHPEERSADELQSLGLVWKSRLLVIIWGIVLTLFTFLLYAASEGIPILPLAFGMTSYTVGPLLGLFLCSLWGIGSLRGAAVGCVISILLVLFMRTDVWVLWQKAGLPIDFLAFLPTYSLSPQGQLTANIFTAWAWPVTTLLTLACAIAIPKKN